MEILHYICILILILTLTLSHTHSVGLQVVLSTKNYTETPTLNFQTFRRVD